MIVAERTDEFLILTCCLVGSLPGHIVLTYSPLCFTWGTFYVRPIAILAFTFVNDRRLS